MNVIETQEWRVKKRIKLFRFASFFYSCMCAKANCQCDTKQFRLQFILLNEVVIQIVKFSEECFIANDEVKRTQFVWQSCLNRSFASVFLIRLLDIRAKLLIFLAQWFVPTSAGCRVMSAASHLINSFESKLNQTKHANRCNGINWTERKRILAQIDDNKTFLFSPI